MTNESEMGGNKFPLQAQKDLRLYLFHVVAAGVKIGIPQEGGVSVSYDLEDALARVSNKYLSEGKRVSITTLGSIPVVDLLKNIELKEKQVSADSEPEQEKQAPQLSKRDFILGLRLTVDEYVKDKEKRQVLKSILTDVEKTLS